MEAMLPDPLSKSAILPFERGASIEAAEPDLPGLSIVIPIYNAGPFLERTLRSLLLNDLTGVEVIVMDGGSTDATPALLDYYAHALSVVVSEPDDGQSDAINKGFARAKGPILSWLNGDDLLLPGALNAVRRAFRDAGDAEIVVGAASLTELDLSVIHRFTPAGLSFERLLDYAENHLIQPAVFFSRTAWEAAGPLKTDHHYAMDADLFLTMAARFKMHTITQELAYSVFHDACKTREKRAESICELALVQARHGGFAEAAKTLSILVDLYNATRAKSARDAGWDNGDYGLLARRMAALEDEVARNRTLLIRPSTTEPTS